MTRDEDEDVEVEGIFLVETDAAVLLEIEGEEVWLPKSQVFAGLEGDEERGDDVIVTIPAWLAEKKGLA